jgi:hypothetical protein
MSNSEKFVESNQVFAVNMVFALLAWLFSMFVFLPLAGSFVSSGMVSLVAVIMLVAVSYYFYIAACHSAPLIEHVSSKVSLWYVYWRKVEIDERPVVWRRVRKVLGIGITLVVYLAYRPLLWAVNPVFAGIGLIFVLLQIMRQIL